MPFSEFSLPFLHPLIDLDDLHKKNKKLLSDREIAEYKNFLEDSVDGRYRKKVFNNMVPGYVPKYGMIKLGEELFIVYKGVSHGKQIYYNGKNKKVKLVQNAITGEWFALKIEFCPLPCVEVIPTGNGSNSYHVRRTGLDSKFQRMATEIKNISLYASSKLKHNLNNKLLTRTTTVKANDKKWEGYSLGKVSYSFLMPLLPGLSLSHFLDAYYRLPDYRWAEIGMKVLSVVRDFHKKELLHRDVKACNIVYDFINDEVTIVDLEFTQSMNENREYHGALGLSGTGTYLAPELISEFQQAKEEFVYNEYTEAYAAGILLKILFGIPVSLVSDIKTYSKSDPNPDLYTTGSQRSITSHPRVIDLVSRLTSHAPPERKLPLKDGDELLLDSAISHLAATQKEIIATSLVKTAIIDVDNILEYYNRSTPIQKGSLLNALQQFDEICIINVTNTDKDYYFSLLNLQRVLNQDRYKNDGCSDELEEKIPCFKKLLVMKDIKELADIDSYFKSQAADQSNNPARTFTYFDASLCFRVSSNADLKKQCDNNKFLIDKKINVITVEKNKSKTDYLKDIEACTKTVSQNDYRYITNAIQAECDRLEKKYKVTEYSKKKAQQNVQAKPKLDLVHYRHQKLIATLSDIAKLSSLNLSYAAVNALLIDMQKDKKFSTPPASFFTLKKQSNCVSNVEKIRKELESRLGGNRSP